MEFLKRGSLEDEATGAYIHLTRVKKIMIDVLRGLAHAHTQGVLHRDIKPANIMIGDNREAKLSDFGLSLPVGIAPYAIGMKEYLYQMHVPPEVFEGKEYNQLGEIYSCGITMYRMVNGDQYLPQISNETQDKIVSGKAPDRSKYRLYIPQKLISIINKALSVDPSKRYQSADEMRRDIEGLNILINWDEKKLPEDGVEWTAACGNKTYVLQLTKSTNGKWKILFSKGQSKASLRKVSHLSLDDLTKNKARSKARRILQKLTVGTSVNSIAINNS